MTRHSGVLERSMTRVNPNPNPRRTRTFYDQAASPLFQQAIERLRRTTDTIDSTDTDQLDGNDSEFDSERSSDSGGGDSGGDGMLGESDEDVSVVTGLSGCIPRLWTEQIGPVLRWVHR